MAKDKEEREGPLWVVDPAIFQKRAGHGKPFVWVLRLLNRAGAYSAWGAMFAYPLILVYLGLAFGWAGFWGAFLLSLLTLGLVITKAGYAKNFEAWNPSLSRQLATLLLGFAFAVSFYLGLFVLKFWMLPLFVGVLLAGLAYILAR